MVPKLRMGNATAPLLSTVLSPPSCPTPRQVLNALVTAILPGLALKLFVKLLPGLLALMNRTAGGGLGGPLGGTPPCAGRGCL